MKNILLSFCLFFAAQFSAQFNFTQDFSVTTGVSVFGSGSASVNSAVFCSAAPSITQIILDSSTGHGGVFQQMAPIGQHSNGEKIDLSMKFQKSGLGSGEIQLFYAVQESLPGDTSWSLYFIGQPLPVTAGVISDCITVTASLPAGTIPADATRTKNYGFGLYYTRIEGTAILYYDDFYINQQIVQVPDCTVFTAPVPNSVVSAGTQTFTWNPAQNAEGYKVTVGTSPGSGNIFTGTVAGTSAEIMLPGSSTIYASVTPTNSVGDAVGCAVDLVFSTDDALVYCAAGAGSAEFEKITRLLFAGIDNTSDNSEDAPGYENFKQISSTAKRGSSYPFSAVSSVASYATDELLVWIDYNQNGSFDDVGELVLRAGPSPSPWNGSISIPTDAMLGETRMRVRLHDTSFGANDTSCGLSNYGQVEDYTLKITEGILSTGSPATARVSLYPNPVNDFLTVSDTTDVIKITITDLSGREIRNLKSAPRLNLSDLRAGLYFVTLHFKEGKTQSFKIIKK